MDVSQQVVGILITHWHSDHIEGASALLKACPNAKLYFSIALLQKEAFQLAGLYKNDIFADTDKEIREFREIVEFLRETNDRNRFAPVKNRHTFFRLQKYGTNTSSRLIA